MTHPLVNAYIEGRAKFKSMAGKYFDNGKNPKAACDVGAMYWGFYKKVSLNAFNDLIEDFPILGSASKELDTNKLVRVPCNHDGSEPVGYILSILIHLNDEHDGRSGWTTEKKAAWLSEVLGG